MRNPQYTIHNIYCDAFGIYIQFFITMIEDMMLLPGYFTHVKNIMDNIFIPENIDVLHLFLLFILAEGMSAQEQKFLTFQK